MGDKFEIELIDGTKKEATLITISENNRPKVFDKNDINYLVLFTDCDEIEYSYKKYDLLTISMKELFDFIKNSSCFIEELNINPYKPSSLILDRENFLFIFE